MGCVLHLLIKKFKIIEPSYACDRKITFTVTNRWHSKTEQPGFRSVHRKHIQQWIAVPVWK